MAYVKVEGDGEVIEFPVQHDGTLLLSVIDSQFEGTSGLRYLSDESQAKRAVVLHEGSFISPEEGWGSRVYSIVRKESNKRRADLEGPVSKALRTEGSESITPGEELIVLGLPWRTTQLGMQRYFEKFGPVAACEVKMTPDGRSRGFGFIWMADSKDRQTVLNQSMSHQIDGRRIEVKEPRDRKEFNKKIFVGRLQPTTTDEEILAYFQTYGEVKDVYIPKPHRGFGFVTFGSHEAVSTLLTETHRLNGQELNVTAAEPKKEAKWGKQPFPGAAGGAPGYGYAMPGQEMSYAAWAGYGTGMGAGMGAGMGMGVGMAGGYVDQTRTNAATGFGFGAVQNYPTGFGAQPAAPAQPPAVAQVRDQRMGYF